MIILDWLPYLRIKWGWSSSTVWSSWWGDKWDRKLRSSFHHPPPRQIYFCIRRWGQLCEGSWRL